MNASEGKLALQSLYDLASRHKLPHAIIIECSNQEKAFREAIRIAKTAMCHLDTDFFCGECKSCLKIENGSHPDVKAIFPVGNSIKVDEIRYIRQDACILPNESDYKFYIIKYANYLTSQAQNAFIKILEEPPKNVIFIILCEFVNSLLDTVLSRCEIFRLTDVSKETMNTECLKLAKNLVQASIKEDKVEIFKIISLIPSDRLYVRNLLEFILENLINIFKQENFNLNSEKNIKKIDELLYISKLIRKNVNLNLLISYLNMIL